MTAIFNLTVNFVLIIMMLNTKKRTRTNPRLNVENEYFLTNPILAMSSPLNQHEPENLKFSVKFQEKAIEL